VLHRSPLRAGGTIFYGCVENSFGCVLVVQSEAPQAAEGSRKIPFAKIERFNIHKGRK